MDRSDWDDNDENLDEDNDERIEKYSGRDGLIFLIDATKPMFMKQEGEECPIKISLQCCLTTMKNKIISSEKDVAGIVLFGTSKKNNELDVSNIFVLQDLIQPGAESLKKLENIVKSDDFFDHFSDKYGHYDQYSLADALWLCQVMFTDNAFTLNSQRILLFTNNDNPHKCSTAKQIQAMKKALDIGNLNMDLELLHMGKDFNPDLFYKELVQIIKGDNSEDWKIPDPTNKFEELLSRVSRKDYKQRILGKISLTLGEGISMNVNVYNLVRRTPAPKRVRLDKSTNLEVKSSKQVFNRETGAIALLTDQVKYQVFGDKKIFLETQEIRQIKKMMEPGLRLLGFTPASRIKIQHHLKPSSFIYPVEGSSQMFTALLQRCIERDVVPVCWYALRHDVAPAQVALVPQKEVLDDSELQELPPGFHVVFLPYLDDTKKLDIEPSMVKAEPEHIEKAAQIIRKLRFRYKPCLFDNPWLQTLWRNIEAKALDPDPEDVRTVVDVTVPNYDRMRNKLGSLSREFLDEVYPPDYVPGEEQKAKKRQLDVKNEARSKKEKTTTDNIDMKDLAERGKVETLKVNDLKAYLATEDIKLGGLKKKADLVSKVYEHLGVPQP